MKGENVDIWILNVICVIFLNNKRRSARFDARLTRLTPHSQFFIVKVILPDPWSSSFLSALTWTHFVRSLAGYRDEE